MATFRSASYTRGAVTASEASSHLAFSQLDRPQQPQQQHEYPNSHNHSGNQQPQQQPQHDYPNSHNHSANQHINHRSTSQFNGATQGQTSFQGSSMGLSQYRRHAASMSAAPLRGAAFADDVGDQLSANGSRRIRSASWAPESPKATLSGKTYYSKSIGEKRKGRMWNLIRRFEESKCFNSRLIKANKKEFMSWFMLACLVVVGYKFFSDGSFSAVLTLASALQCFALLLLNMKVLCQQSVAGVSQRTLFLIVGSLSCRLVSTMLYNGYLPVDRSGDWVYQAADVLTVVFAVALILYARHYCRASLQQQQDKDTCAVMIPVILTFILSLVIHPSLNQNLFADVAWTFALYVETFAMIPQLFMMGKLGGEVEALTSHYVASMAGSKVFTFLFWYFSYNELAPKNGRYNFAGWAVLFSNSAQVLLFADFMYYYAKSMMSSSSLRLTANVLLV